MKAHASDLDSAYSWSRLGVSMIVATVGSVGMWAIILVLPKIQAEFGVDRAGASLAYTATMVGFAFGNLLIGRLVDRVGIVPVLMAAALSLLPIWNALRWAMCFGRALRWKPATAQPAS